LAQKAAIEALRNSSVVIFCVDISKSDWSEDAAVRKRVEPKITVPVATKCDLVPAQFLPDRLVALNETFGTDFLPTSVQTGVGIELLRRIIDGKLTEKFNVPQTGGVALTARHRKAVTETIGQIGESVNELNAGNDEVAAMTLRAAYQALSDIEQPGAVHIDEQILGQIFSRFCIGK
jgi:tRNA U34 5-carboxymethylaminomethyl modifying GTPase MnmE/TrmE